MVEERQGEAAFLEEAYPGAVVEIVEEAFQEEVSEMEVVSETDD